MNSKEHFKVKGELKKFSGKVGNYNAISTNRVCVEFQGDPNAYDLMVSDAWVVSKNDHIEVVGIRDDKIKKIYCFAYKNISKNNVSSRYELPNKLGYMFIFMSIPFFGQFFHYLYICR
jgi:hypothetical protein